jgi:hypothetical protein
MPRHHPVALRREACKRIARRHPRQGGGRRARRLGEHPLKVEAPGPDRCWPASGVKSYEADPLAQARRRIKALEAELEVTKLASALFERCRPKRKYRVVRRLSNLGYSERRGCAVVGTRSLDLLRHQVPQADRS